MFGRNNVTLGSPQRPVRIAIIGAGPAGFYTISALLSQSSVHVSIDLFDKLPAPYGLVRYGVAPDHEKIKRVQETYETLAQDSRVRFFGNVTFGQDILHTDIRAHYDQVVYTTGAESDRALGIPGESLQGSYSATEFVAWYNAHPEFAHHTFDLSHETAIVVGMGNVAIDAARILAKSPEELQPTDIADHALLLLRQSQVKNIYVLGRRGPVQAKFSTPEIKEFRNLQIADPIVSTKDLELDEVSLQQLDSDRTAKRNIEVLREYANRSPSGKPRKVHFCFLVSPVEILGNSGRVSAIRLVRNRLEKSEGNYPQRKTHG